MNDLPLGLKPVQLGFLGEVAVDDPHHGVYLLAGQPIASEQLVPLHVYPFSSIALREITAPFRRPCPEPVANGEVSSFLEYDSTKASRPMLARSINARANGPGSGSRTTRPTPAQGPNRIEVSSPAVVPLTRQQPDVPSSRNILATSSKLKTGSASSPEARVVLKTSIPPTRFFTINHNGLVQVLLTRNPLPSVRRYESETRAPPLRPGGLRAP